MKFYIGETKNNGKGLFATRDIKKDEAIGTARGPIVLDNKESWQKHGGWHFFHPISRTKAIVIQNKIKYFNHSCNPNCGIKKGIKIVAMRDIKKGEELTIDYDTLEYDWGMKCNCGSKNCRKTIRGYKYLSERLKKKYKGYIADYLLKN